MAINEEKDWSIDVKDGGSRVWVIEECVRTAYQNTWVLCAIWSSEKLARKDIEKRRNQPGRRHSDYTLEQVELDACYR